MLVMIYSGIFSAAKDNHPVPSIYTEATGRESASSGLSRSFSEIIRGNFDAARSYNPHGIQLFLFFMVQFVMRLSATLIILKHPLTKLQVYADSIASIILFAVCFSPFLQVWKFM